MQGTIRVLIVLMSLWSAAALAAQPTEAPQPSIDTFESLFNETQSAGDTLPDLLRDKELLPQSCCKVCRKGKACGNSCISRSYTCTKPPGCACDG
ncbi:MAG: hypothetical protein HUJ15_05430 [Alcanivorax sp.]|jgi:hypothetical protein|nr:hypothetical protein [Alcanivorax sp.]|tara:strand:- start:57287 stop:57571 length:285 start_codon:yes stop_codon:yes gene_type:complete